MTTTESARSLPCDTPRFRLTALEWRLWLTVVLSGVYFAAIQFHAGLRRHGGIAARASAGDEEGTAIETETVTTFSASAKGIEVSSPVLGVIILVISLAFFYLYLVYVYPVTELF